MPSPLARALAMAVSFMVTCFEPRLPARAPSARARRCRSFSSASDRRVYTGRAKAGSWRSASRGSHSPARHEARSAIKRPAPVGVHNASGRSAPAPSKRSAYLRRASPAIRRSEPPDASSSSAKASALITRSAVTRSAPASLRRYSTGYTSRRMASATTSNDPRSLAFHAPQATASSDETPTRPTSNADAMPLAQARAMRTPVNDPGPRPTATQAISPRPTPAWAHSSSIRGSSWVFDARRASTSTLATHSIDCVAASSFPSPMAMTSLAVSKASTKERCVFKGRTFPKTTNQCGLLYPTARAPQDSEPKIANCPRSLYSWHFPKRDLESLAQTHRSWREREPKECATMRRAPSPSAVMAISR